MSRLTISRAGLDLIESFEGFRAKSYLLKSGRYTIGFGHVATAREGMQLTREQAEDLLKWDIKPIEDFIRQSSYTPLTQSQFDALVSFVFNIGIENYRNSDVIKYLNQGNNVAAALSISAWRKAMVNGEKIIIDALVRRRFAESSMFLETIGPRPAAPTSVVKPYYDETIEQTIPNSQEIKILGQKSVPSIALKSEQESISETEIEKKVYKDENILPVLAEVKQFEAVQEPQILSNTDNKLKPFPLDNQPKAANESLHDSFIIANSNEENSAPQAAKPLDIIKSRSTESVFKLDKAPIFDFTNLFIILTGLIAFLAGLFKLNNSGFFSPQVLQKMNFTTSQIGFVIVAIIGFIAAVIGILSLLNKEED